MPRPLPLPALMRGWQVTHQTAGRKARAISFPANRGIQQRQRVVARLRPARRARPGPRSRISGCASNRPPCNVDDSRVSLISLVWVPGVRLAARRNKRAQLRPGANHLFCTHDRRNWSMISVLRVCFPSAMLTKKGALLPAPQVGEERPGRTGTNAGRRS